MKMVRVQLTLPKCILLGDGFERARDPSHMWPVFSRVVKNEAPAVRALIEVGVPGLNLKVPNTSKVATLSYLALIRIQRVGIQLLPRNTRNGPVGIALVGTPDGGGSGEGTSAPGRHAIFIGTIYIMAGEATTTNGRE